MKIFLKPLAVPATGGILTALLVFVLVAHNVLVGVPMGIVPNDLPLNLVQPARLESLAPFPLPGSPKSGDSGSAPLLLEATLNAQGQVVSYRILAGPSDQAVLRQIDQMMMFSHFRPGTQLRPSTSRRPRAAQLQRSPRPRLIVAGVRSFLDSTQAAI